tara:strand:+ start:532 stop:1041 length:510 start_codon:yes stop_codon:yes gene_type:complete
MKDFFNCEEKIKILCIICAIVIFKYSKDLDELFGAGAFSGPHTKSFLTIHYPGGQFTMWSVSHFLFFMCIGIICPKHFNYALALGIIWECFEFYLEYDRQVVQNPMLCKYINTCDTKKVNESRFFNKYLGKESSKNLFYCSSGYLGQLSDIVLNSCGYLFGQWLHKKIM